MRYERHFQSAWAALQPATLRCFLPVCFPPTSSLTARMVDVQPEDDKIRFVVQGMHKLWAFKSELLIPKEHIIGARHDPSAVRFLMGLRALGTSVPGLIQAGTFYFDGLGRGHKASFLDVSDKANTMVVSLRDETYQQLIIEVADPAAVVALLHPSGSL